MAPRRRAASIFSSPLAGYFVTALTVLIAPAIAVAPESRSSYFWFKILWTQYLALLVWAYLGGAFAYFFGKRTGPPSIGGIVPALGLLILGYAGSSFGLMLLMRWPSRAHWTVQILLFAAMALASLLLMLARRGASQDAAAGHMLQPTPDDFAVRVRVFEDRFWSAPLHSPGRSLVAELRSLREVLQHSLPSTVKVLDSQEYEDLTTAIEHYLAHLAEIRVDNRLSEEVDSQLRNTAFDLRLRVEALSSISRVRPSDVDDSSARLRP